MTKVFVSSKQGELDPEREALHHALQSPEWDNFTFEWSGAFPDSARDVYLKQVAEADVYLGIFFKTYSQATVDEYYEAKRFPKPILIYLKDCAEREPALTKFITEELYPAHKCKLSKRLTSWSVISPTFAARWMRRCKSTNAKRTSMYL